MRNVKIEMLYVTMIAAQVVVFLVVSELSFRK
jgi:hypothetical protein